MANLINIKMKKAALVFLSFLIAVTSFSAIATNANTQAYAITNDDVETTIVEVAGKRIYDEAYKVLSYINKERKAQGLAKLTIDSELTEYAMVRAAELTILYSHTRPNGGSLLGWNNNVYDYLGENIAGGQKTAKKVYTAWYNSAWHYAAMVDSVYKSVGIGCFKDTDGHYYWSLVLGFYDGDGEYSTKNKTVSQPVEIVVDYDYENDITMQRFWDEDCNCNHYWKRATVITAASKETKGKIKYKCTDCGKTKTVSVAKVKCATLSTKTYT
ncbi:MAG: CAP domain-containing protein, partial [Clostridiales bacterium]|nr:CAP domain-containing protein [Clostridiales bacterium]